MQIFIKITKIFIYICVIMGFYLNPAYSFVGVFISKDGSKIISQGSKVVIAKKDQKIIYTFTSDLDTKAKQFILLVPVPADIKNPHVRTIDYKLINKLDLYTSPRLIEYINFDPCDPTAFTRPPIVANHTDKAIGLGSVIPKTTSEHKFFILTSKESAGIRDWLKKYDYNLPSQYLNILKKYIAKNMRFIVIEVKNHNSKVTQLAPVQIEYESKNFLLPIRVGSLNAPNSMNQDMTVYILSNLGEVLPVNYKINETPNNIDLPISTIGNFNQFYSHLMYKLFASHPDIIRKEYSWPMNVCKPCTSTSLTIEELQELGAFWYSPSEPKLPYITRLHTHYSPEYSQYSLADSIEFKETTKRLRYQTYFNLKHPMAMMQSKCGDQYYEEIKKAKAKEDKNFHMLAPKPLLTYHKTG